MAAEVLHLPTQGPMFTAEQKDLIRKMCHEFTETEKEQFILNCERTRLDPLMNQIYPINRSGRLTIQVSIDGFRLIAERTGEYAGQLGPLWCGKDGKWRDIWIDDDPPAGAKVGVLRKGFDEPLWSPARFKSYNQPSNRIWQSLPEVMIAKVAEALALRRAFPNELGGIYVKEEMDQADTETSSAPPLSTGERLTAMLSETGISKENWKAVVRHMAGKPESANVGDKLITWALDKPASEWVAAHTAILEAVASKLEGTVAEQAEEPSTEPTAPQPTETAKKSPTIKQQCDSRFAEIGYAGKPQTLICYVLGIPDAETISATTYRDALARPVAEWKAAMEEMALEDAGEEQLERITSENEGVPVQTEEPVSA